MIKIMSGNCFCDWETTTVVMNTVTTYTVKTVYSARCEVACPTESHCASVATASTANLSLQKLFLSITDYGAASDSASLATSQ